MVDTQVKDRYLGIRRRIFQIDGLAAMPDVVWRVLDTLDDDRSGAEDVARLIETDPGLTAKVLRLSNSAFYGLPGQVTTVARAITVIGFLDIRLLVLGAGLTEVFDLRKCSGDLDGLDLWRHCLAVSLGARELARVIGSSYRSEVMIAGLLHDLGKLLLVTHLEDEFCKISECLNQGMPYWLAEETTGLRHTTLGYWLAIRWRLPEIYSVVIRDHHELRPDSPFFLPTSIVQLADQMIKSMGIGLVHESRSQGITDLLGTLRMDRDDYQVVFQKVKAEIEEMRDHWETLLNGGGQ